MRDWRFFDYAYTSPVMEGLGVSSEQIPGGFDDASADEFGYGMPSDGSDFIPVSLPMQPLGPAYQPQGNSYYPGQPYYPRPPIGSDPDAARQACNAGGGRWQFAPGQAFPGGRGSCVQRDGGGFVGQCPSQWRFQNGRCVYVGGITPQPPREQCPPGYRYASGDPMRFGTPTPGCYPQSSFDWADRAYRDGELKRMQCEQSRGQWIETTGGYGGSCSNSPDALPPHIYPYIRNCAQISSQLNPMLRRTPNSPSLQQQCYAAGGIIRGNRCACPIVRQRDYVQRPAQQDKSLYGNLVPSVEPYQ